MALTEVEGQVVRPRKLAVLGGSYCFTVIMEAEMETVGDKSTELSVGDAGPVSGTPPDISLESILNQPLLMFV